MFLLREFRDDQKRSVKRSLPRRKLKTTALKHSYDIKPKFLRTLPMLTYPPRYCGLYLAFRGLFPLWNLSGSPFRLRLRLALSNEPYSSYFSHLQVPPLYKRVIDDKKGPGE
jgi:hypothetical protein